MTKKWGTVWITGASSGIGYSLASKLLTEGNIVIATARDISKLKSLQSKFQNALFCYKLDVSNESDVQQFCALLYERFTCIDTMILNAGICEYIEWPNLDLQAMHRNMSTNFWGVVNCIAYGLNLLRNSKQPYIVAISSAAHIVGLPRAEGYGASKAALHYFLQTLQVELHKSNVKLSIVTPGFVKTELTAKNDFPMPLLVPLEKATTIILQGMSKRKPEIKFPILLILILNILSMIPDKLRNLLLSKTIRSK
jgi:short-subunit dehydrogenase